jgi:hypothetical protein
MEEEGILNACTTKLRTKSAISAAMIRDSAYSLHLLFIVPASWVTTGRLPGFAEPGLIGLLGFSGLFN